jgi:hypothetical protein
LEDILPHRWWDRDPLARFFLFHPLLTCIAKTI